MSAEAESSSFSHGWTILRAGGRKASGIEIPTFPTDVMTIEGPVRLALGASGEARILMPLADEADAATVLGAPALLVRVSSYSENGSPKRFLDITCLSRELETAFSEVVNEILARIAGGTHCAEAARSTIEEFRSLLMRPPGAEVQASTIAGLIGELLFLNRLLDQSPDAWKCWRGPAGDRHDFARGTTAVEIKCTLRKGRTAITVNGLDQLEPPRNGALFLLHLELEIVAAGTLSVSGLGNAVLQKASDPDAVRNLVAAIGCAGVDHDAWNSIRLRLENETLYSVGQGFPRLVPSMLPESVAPPGISAVSYIADLSLAEEFRLAPEHMTEIAEALLSGCL